MSRIEKRFQLLLTEEEMDLLKAEATNRNISSGELLRLGLRNEIGDRKIQDKVSALDTLVALQDKNVY